MRSDRHTPWINRIKTFTDDRRGAVYIWVAFGMLGMIGFAGLAVDMSYFYAVRNQMQTSADSAALAGAIRMSNVADMKMEAKKYAQMNIVDDDQILADGDIQRGTWDFASKTFTVGGANANAVRVTTRMAQANGNAAGTFFAGVLGFDNVDISTSAVAAYSTDDEWDVLVVQDVTGSFSAEIGDARDANHVLLDCLQQKPRRQGNLRSYYKRTPENRSLTDFFNTFSHKTTFAPGSHTITEPAAREAGRRGWRRVPEDQPSPGF